MMKQLMSLRFACQPNCSNCCQVEGEVYLTEQDLQRMAEYTGMNPETFEATYVYRTKRLLRLRKPHGRQCHFHQNNCCSIHPVKPTQCRTFPFWPELIEDAKAWEEASQYCPGMGKGELIQIENARHIAGEMWTAYPSMYPERH